MKFILSLLIILTSHSQEIAVLMKGLSNPYWKTMEDGINEKAKELKLDLYLQGIQSDSDSEGQLNLCNSMILKKGLKALIFAAVNKVNLKECLLKANSLGLVLVDIDGGTSKEAADKMKVKIAFSIGSDNYLLGKKSAELLKDVSGKALVIEGFAGSEQGLLRINGFKENLSNKIQIIASLPGDWDRLKAFEITSNILNLHPDLSAIFAANDLMALGALEAVKLRKKNVKVIGVDGTKDAINSIKDSNLFASVAQLPYLIGYESIEKTFQIINNKKTFEYNQKIEILPITKEVLNSNLPLLSYVK